MKYFVQTILCTYFVAVLANSTVKLTDRNALKKPIQSDMINNYYSGPNCKEIDQQLVQIRYEIKGLKANKTDCSGENGLSLEVKQQLAEIKQEISDLKENLTGGPDGNGLFPELKQQVAEVKEEIRVLRENLTGGPNGNGLLSEVKQQLFELKEEIRALRGNQTKGESGKDFLKNCAEVYKAGNMSSGVYKIDPDALGEFIEVFCDQKTAGGGWTVFQRRQDGSVDFWRGWKDYKRGFGNLKGEFWLGLDNINRLTASSSNELRVDLEDNHGKRVFAEYSSFAVASERAKYQLSLGSHTGTAGDSLSYHRGLPFTTKDRDNDSWSKNCASSWKGAWWYKSCYNSNLNGLYLNGKSSTQGMAWMKWKNYISVKRSEMKIRPQNF